MATVEQQGLAAVSAHLPDISYNNDMVAAGVDGDNVASEPGQRPIQDRHLGKLGIRAGRKLVRLGPFAGENSADAFLITSEHVDRKTPGPANSGECTRLQVEPDHHEHRVQRE